MARLTAEDEGKDVYNATGTKIGTISEVKGETAYVDPKPKLTDRIRSKLGWDNADEDEYVLDQDAVDDIGDSAVTLRE